MGLTLTQYQINLHVINHRMIHHTEDDMKTKASDLEKIAAAARRTDPLFSTNPLREFEPTIDDAINHIDIQGIPYTFPRSARDRMSLSFDPDRLAAVSTIATQHDMTVSATVDLLLRVALGDYEEWWNNHGEEKKA